MKMQASRPGNRGSKCGKPVGGRRILVTGGAGFIGSHLVDALLASNNEVVVYDNLDRFYPNKWLNLQHNIGNPSFRFVEASVLDFETLLKCMEGIDVVFHLAAQPGVEFSMQNPFSTMQTNVLGTLNVLLAASKVSVKRIVFASSSSVYGNPKYLPEDENHPTNPLSIYGASKLACEKFCKIFNDRWNIPVVMLRYFSVYGPRQRPDMAISKWTKAIFDGNPLEICGDGTQTRDFTYVDDVIDATIKATEIKGIGGEVFNIASGSSTSVHDVVKELNDITDKDAQIVYEPPRAADVQDTHADTTKAKRMLGFSSKMHLKEGLRLFVKWYSHSDQSKKSRMPRV